MFKITTYRNGQALVGGPKVHAFKPYKTRAGAERYAKTLNAYAAGNTQPLRAAGVTIEYRVEAF